jgi:hypothetical protein
VGDSRKTNEPIQHNLKGSYGITRSGDEAMIPAPYRESERKEATYVEIRIYTYENFCTKSRGVYCRMASIPVPTVASSCFCFNFLAGWADRTART